MCSHFALNIVEYVLPRVIEVPFSSLILVVEVRVLAYIPTLFLLPIRYTTGVRALNSSSLSPSFGSTTTGCVRLLENKRETRTKHTGGGPKPVQLENSIKTPLINGVEKIFSRTTSSDTEATPAKCY